MTNRFLKQKRNLNLIPFVFNRSISTSGCNFSKTQLVMSEEKQVIEGAGWKLPRLRDHNFMAGTKPGIPYIRQDLPLSRDDAPASWLPPRMHLAPPVDRKPIVVTETKPVKLDMNEAIEIKADADRCARKPQLGIKAIADRLLMPPPPPPPPPPLPPSASRLSGIQLLPPPPALPVATPLPLPATTLSSLIRSIDLPAEMSHYDQTTPFSMLQNSLFVQSATLPTTTNSPDISLPLLPPLPSPFVTAATAASQIIINN